MAQGHYKLVYQQEAHAGAFQFGIESGPYTMRLMERVSNAKALLTEYPYINERNVYVDDPANPIAKVLTTWPEATIDVDAAGFVVSHSHMNVVKRSGV